MPKARLYQLISCDHFAWRLSRRQGVWYADGRSNQLDAGRHSLGTRDKATALKELKLLDVQRAVDLGLIAHPTAKADTQLPLTLAKGRRLYEAHIGRAALPAA